jgi:hypothetical protein
MITVDSIVVVRDSEIALRYTGMPILAGISCGVTSSANSVIPRPKSTYQPSYPWEPLHTYRCNIEDQRDSHCHPAPVACDPAPPDLQIIEGY